MTTDNETSVINVTQADRDLAYDILLPFAENWVHQIELQGLKEGLADDADAVQLAARHRTTSLAALDGLVDALRDVLKWLKDPQMGTWTYIEGNYFYRDVDAHAKAIEAALASIEVKS